MITSKMIERINELAKKQRTGELSEAERTEQASLRRLYINEIKAQVKAQLDAAKPHTHSAGCSCGCHKHH